MRCPHAKLVGMRIGGVGTVHVKKPASLNWQVDLRITKQLICTVSACKASRHAGWRGMDTTGGDSTKVCFYALGI